MVFQNLFPARGRKRSYFLVGTFSQSRFSEPIPRKGTETVSISIIIILSTFVFQNLFPARGRKLNCEDLSYMGHKVNRFSEPIPRKGTETLEKIYAASPGGNPLVFQNLFPARGRKL